MVEYNKANFKLSDTQLKKKKKKMQFKIKQEQI